MKIARSKTHSELQWLALCQKYGNRCLKCGEKKVLTKDHIIPVSKFGDDGIDNIQPLCQPCNSSKSDRVIDFRPERSCLWDGIEKAMAERPVYRVVKHHTPFGTTIYKSFSLQMARFRFQEELPVAKKDGHKLEIITFGRNLCDPHQHFDLYDPALEGQSREID